MAVAIPPPGHFTMTSTATLCCSRLLTHSCPQTMAAPPKTCKVILADTIARKLLQEVQETLASIGNGKPRLVAFLANDDDAAVKYAEYSQKTCEEKYVLLSGFPAARGWARPRGNRAGAGCPSRRGGGCTAADSITTAVSPSTCDASTKKL